VNPKGGTCIINKKNQLKLKLKFKTKETSQGFSEGEIYCVWIENGEFARRAGGCE
jgi:hypothetical protein